VAETGGTYRFISRYSAKCLTAVGTADSTQLVQSFCNGGAGQSFTLTQQP
jgi:hypothetical protein